MNRRSALLKTAMLGLSAPLFFNGALLKTVNNSKSRKALRSFHPFKLGKLQLMVVSDGHIFFNRVQPDFAPEIAPEKVEKVLKENFLPTGEVDLAINILLVKTQDRIILIDSGCGYNFGNQSGWLPENLKDAGINPADITDIILTHAHPDHLGGLLTSENNLVFSNAEIYLANLENNFWMGANPDFSKTKAKRELIDMVTKIARNTITHIKPKLHFFNDGDVLFDCIRLKIAPGHTPGQTIVNIFSEDEELYHLADLVHSASLVVAHPDWGFEGDADFELAIQTRKKILEELSIGRKMLFSYHLPWPGLGHVSKQQTGYNWVQTTFSTPD